MQKPACFENHLILKGNTTSHAMYKPKNNMLDRIHWRNYTGEEIIKKEKLMYNY